MKGRHRRRFPGKQAAAAKRPGAAMGCGVGTALAPQCRHHTGNWHHLRLRKKSGMVKGWGLTGQGCLLALEEAFWVSLG